MENNILEEFNEDVKAVLDELYEETVRTKVKKINLISLVRVDLVWKPYSAKNMETEIRL